MDKDRRTDFHDGFCNIRHRENAPMKYRVPTNPQSDLDRYLVNRKRGVVTPSERYVLEAQDMVIKAILDNRGRATDAECN